MGYTCQTLVEPPVGEFGVDIGSDMTLFLSMNSLSDTIRPHDSPDFDNLESPELAFWRKLPQEAILGLDIRFFG